MWHLEIDHEGDYPQEDEHVYVLARRFCKRVPSKKGNLWYQNDREEDECEKAAHVIDGEQDIGDGFHCGIGVLVLVCWL